VRFNAEQCVAANPLSELGGQLNAVVRPLAGARTGEALAPRDRAYLEILYVGLVPLRALVRGERPDRSRPREFARE